MWCSCEIQQAVLVLGPVDPSIRLRKWVTLLNNRVCPWGTNAIALKPLISQRKCQCIHYSFSQSVSMWCQASEKAIHCLRRATRFIRVLSIVAYWAGEAHMSQLKKKRWSWVWIYSQGVEYWNRAIFPLLTTITSMAIKASMEMVDFCRFVSREFCSSPVSKFCLP